MAVPERPKGSEEEERRHYIFSQKLWRLFERAGIRHNISTDEARDKAQESLEIMLELEEIGEGQFIYRKRSDHNIPSERKFKIIGNGRNIPK